jgi:hypothetical protein
MLRLLVVACVLLPARATVLDRLAITVGQQVITERQLDEELRVSAFLNREKITREADARRSAADHLIQQLLVRREMELSHYPLPADEDVDKYLAQVRASYASPAIFAQSLAKYDLTEATLSEHLALQLTTLRFIEYRFRPDVGISDADIEASFRSAIVEWKANHPGATAPSLAASRESIRKDLLEHRTDEVLNSWLEETRKQVNIMYLDKSLR